MNVKQAEKDLLYRMNKVYEAEEAANITDMVMEHVTGWKRADRLLYKNVLFNHEQESLYFQISDALYQHKPVQYALGEAWFYNMLFIVNESVLIPRPETEELVAWILEDAANGQQINSILDVGTGSGCIPIVLKKKLPDAQVFACDISDAALEVASDNAFSIAADVQFVQCDFLQDVQRKTLPVVDVIVSNPPYIPLKDKATMHANVLQFEPHLALFVTDKDPLVFYKALADFAKTHLHTNGKVYMEIHEDYGAQVQELFTKAGFTNVVLKKDMQGKDRMLRAAY